MILCITPNPAIDRTIILPSLVLGEVHRAERSIVAAGGKGLNVARAINILGGEPLCMGFLGGHSGRLLADLAKNEGLNSSWTWVNSETRTCLILVSQTGGATEIDEQGSSVSGFDWRRLQQEVRKYLSTTDLACVCGSLPPGSSPDDLYGLLSLLIENGKQVWLDTSGVALQAALSYAGLCVKVNGDEIGRSLGFVVNDLSSAKRALRILEKRNLSACVITLGAAGAVLATPAGRWYARGPFVSVVSPIGSGDSFLAGLINALVDGKDAPESLLDAVAAGTANTLSAGGGQFTMQEFKDIREQIKIQRC